MVAVNFVAAMAAFWVLTAWPARDLGDLPLATSGWIAGAITGPAAVALIAIRLSESQHELLKVGILAGSVFFRMVFTVGIVGWISYLDPSLVGRELAALVYGSLFYLVSLAIETAMIYRRIVPKR
jgi:hypothetical protein